MHRRAVVTGLLLSTAASTADAAVIVPRYTGEVTVKNAAKLLELVSDNQDKVIGLAITVTGNTEAEFKQSRYLVHAEDRNLGITKDEMEIVINETFHWLHGAYVVDGFFVVKSGGMHQGTISYGLMPTDEAAVRLNGNVKIQDRPL